ncbi:MAG: gliding motility-associated C-terminal domain-containing protein, partial [Chitinophagales bacterium]
PSMAGTYYAEMVDLTDECVSERVAVTLSENPEIVLGGGDTYCSAGGLTYNLQFSLSGGTGFFTIDVGDLLLEEFAFGLFGISGIEIGNSVTVTATDEAGCSVSATFGPPNCDCPTVNPPIGATNNQYCEDETPTPISVLVASTGFEIRWYDAETDGNLLATGKSFTPSTAGTYYAEMVDLTTDCVSERVAVTLTAIDCTACTPPEAPIPLTSQSAVTCSGEPVEFVLTALSNTLIKWYDAVEGGNLVAIGSTYLTDEPGSYFAVAVNESDSTCVSSPTAFNLSLQIPAESSFTATASDGCVGDAIEFSLASGIAENIAYIWTFIDMENGDTIGEHIGAEPFTMVFDSMGMYEVQLLAVSNDPAICDGSTLMGVSISDMVVETIEDVRLTLGESLEIPVDISATIGEFLTFSWSASTGEIPCEDCEFLTVSPQQNTTYTVEVTDEFGCAASADVSVIVESNEMALVANAFSPNGDGVNDRFYVMGLNIETIDFQVYNRFGERIFQTSEVGDGWDGTYKNQDLDIGSYAYFVVVTYRSGERELLKGNVTLIR